MWCGIYFWLRGGLKAALTLNQYIAVLLAIFWELSAMFHCFGIACILSGSNCVHFLLITCVYFSGKPFKKPASLVSQQHKKKRKREEIKKVPSLIPINQFISQACKLCKLQSLFPSFYLMHTVKPCRWLEFITAVGTPHFCSKYIPRSSLFTDLLFGNVMFRCTQFPSLAVWKLCLWPLESKTLVLPCWILE